MRLLLPTPLPGRRILIVTSDYHADRAELIFRFIFGPESDIRVAAVPTCSVHNVAKEKESLDRFLSLFAKIEAGDLCAIVDRFWQGHALYKGGSFIDLQHRTRVALAQIQQR